MLSEEKKTWGLPVLLALLAKLFVSFKGTIVHYMAAPISLPSNTLAPGVDGGILLPAQKRFEPLLQAGGSFSTEATFLLESRHGHGRPGPLSGTGGIDC